LRGERGGGKGKRRWREREEEAGGRREHVGRKWEERGKAASRSKGKREVELARITKGES
jgi:hypothetical protein